MYLGFYIGRQVKRNVDNIIALQFVRLSIDYIRRSHLVLKRTKLPFAFLLHCLMEV